jgi:hypothetical protein
MQQFRHQFHAFEGDLFRFLSGHFVFHQALVADLDTSNGVDADEGIAVVLRVVVGALHEDGIPEPVAQPQVNPHGRMNVGQHFGELGSDLDLLHWIKTKRPRCYRGLMMYVNT